MRTPDEIKRDLERQKTFSERLEQELALASKNIDDTLAKTYEVPENAITVKEITKISNDANSSRAIIDAKVKELTVQFKRSFDNENDLSDRILNYVRLLFDNVRCDYDFDGDESHKMFDTIEYRSDQVIFTQDSSICCMGPVSGLQIIVKYEALVMPIEQLLDLQKIAQVDKYVTIYDLED